jgi:hypothetical protein
MTAATSQPDDLPEAIRSQMYEPIYPVFVEEVGEHEEDELPLARFLADAATSIATEWGTPGGDGDRT